MAAILGVLGFLALLTLVVTIRSCSESKWDIRTSDAIVAAVPVLIGLLAAGVFDYVRVGPDGLEVKRAIQHALQKPAPLLAVAGLLVEHVTAAGKQSDSAPAQRVDDLVHEGTQALVFPMVPTHKTGEIDLYVKQLLPQPFFRYVIIEDDEGHYFGTIPAQSLRELIAPTEKYPTELTAYETQFVDWLNTANRSELVRIPGFIQNSIGPNESKLTALQMMDRDNLSFLPVVSNGKFVGVTDRAQTVAGVLVDISNELGLQDGKDAK